MNLLNTLTRSYVVDTPYTDVSQSLGAIVVISALAAVIIRTALEARQRAGDHELIHRLDAITIPLLLALAIIILNRFLELLAG
ncbi:MAG TPA: hypothetical protein VKY59_01910 [Spirillospora sp.]|nr:hypothetical protein [Spirillospora sp.]